MTLQEVLTRFRTVGPEKYPEGSYHWKEKNLTFSNQRPEGKSSWATWVRLGLMSAWDVIWVFQPNPPRQWWGILISTRGKTFFFDLRTQTGKEDLRNFEAGFLWKMEELYLFERDEKERILSYRER